MSEITVWVHHAATGQPLAVLDEYGRLEYVKVTNGLGAFSVQVPSSFDFSILQEDTRIVIHRKPNGGTKSIDFVGFVRYLERKTSTSEYRTIAGPCLNALLDSRIVAYAAGTAYADKSTYADDMVKAIVRENLGALCVVAARDLSSFGLSVQANSSQGTSLPKGFSWRNVLSALQDISDASHSTESTSVYFGIVPLSTGWDCEFRTNIQQWGVDRRFPNGTSPIIFSLAFGNIANAERSIDYREEKTYAYAGGQGEGTARVTQESSDTARIGASPFNRREVFVDARAESVTANVLEAARAAVRSNRPRNLFAAELVDTTQYVYGRDYFHGDYVTAIYLGEQIDCRIDTVKVSVQEGVEAVSIGLRAES